MMFSTSLIGELFTLRMFILKADFNTNFDKHQNLLFKCCLA